MSSQLSSKLRQLSLSISISMSMRVSLGIMEGHVMRFSSVLSDIIGDVSRIPVVAAFAFYFGKYIMMLAETEEDAIITSALWCRMKFLLFLQ